MAFSGGNKSIFAEPWQKFLDEFGEAPTLSGTLEDIFKGWEVLIGKVMAKYEIPAPDESVKTEKFDLSNFWVRTFTPPSPTGKEPVGVYFHGGGWVMGSVDQDDAVCRLLSKRCQMNIVSVEYRMAPKHKYPIPLDDCVEAAKWAMKHYSADDVVLMGGSAGGNLAFGAALRLIDEGLSKNVKGVVALVPVTIHPDAVPTDKRSQYTAYTENATNTVNTKAAMEVFFDTYGAPPDDKYTSCLLHPRLADLPRCWISESGTDTLRDDARLMRDALVDAGVEVKYEAYPGYPHYSWNFPSKHLAEHQGDFFQRLIQGINWVNEATAQQ